MAEAKKDFKKDGKKPAGGGDSKTSLGFIFFALLILFFVIVPSIVSFFGLNFGWFNSRTWISVTSFFTELLSNVLTSISFLSIFCVFIFAIAIYYARFQKTYILQEYERKLKNKYEPATQGQSQGRTFSSPQSFQASNQAEHPSTGRPIERPLPHNVVPGFPGSEIEPLQEHELGIPQFGEAPKNEAKHQVVNPRWEEVKTHIASHSPSEWRVAILESDILLYEMLEKMGYPGESVADKLKQVDKASFQKVDDAWKAHRVRNMIAHQGNQYEISRYEAEKTIKLYQGVFEEFYFI